jgi:hypothetical protein
VSSDSPPTRDFPQVGGSSGHRKHACSMLSLSLIFVILVILIALAFDFTNGLHDAANSIATVVSTRVLTPRQAVVWAAFFNFVAFLIFGTTVATTIGKGLIDINVVTPRLIFAGFTCFDWWLCGCCHCQSRFWSHYCQWLD